MSDRKQKKKPVKKAGKPSARTKKTGAVKSQRSGAKSLKKQSFGANKLRCAVGKPSGKIKKDGGAKKKKPSPKAAGKSVTPAEALSENTQKGIRRGEKKAVGCNIPSEKED